MRRDELLLKLGAAKKEAGRTYQLGRPSACPRPARPFTADSLHLRAAGATGCAGLRRREGRYLLRSNLTGEDPATLWRYYMQLTEIEQAFKELKHDLAIRPIFHQREDRIEAHIFLAFIAYCLHVTLIAHGPAVRAGTDAAGHPGEVLHLANGRMSICRPPTGGI